MIRPGSHDDLARTGVLLVVRAPHRAGAIHEEPEQASPDPATPDVELFIAVAADGRVTAYNGHVDLGTGIRTALAQIVAEELDVALDTVTLVLGDTGRVPNQGATIASETIQVTAIPLRQAAATARQHLLGLAADRLGVPPHELTVMDGVVRRAGGNADVSYGELVQGRRIEIGLRRDAPLKPQAAYRLVGASTPRVDIPAKAAGTFVYVHDVRVPGMLHGRVVRPPYAGLDAGGFVGNSLLSVDESSLADIPGVVRLVVIRDFIGIVAEREEQAIRAAAQLRATWAPLPDLPDLNATEAALRANPSVPRQLLDRGDVDAALGSAAVTLRRTYVWPYQMHGSIGPSCSVADVRPDAATIWSGTQNPLMLRADLARLLDLPEERIAILRHEAAGCYGRNCADDVGADAALLSRAVGRPVRVQLSREQEHVWEPKGAGQVMDVHGGLDDAGRPVAYDFATRYPSNGAPTLALLLTGLVPAVPAVFQMGDRTAIPPYAYPTARVTVHDMAPIARASWLRGVSAMPNAFAHESYIDELATEAGVDPIDYRLRLLDDPRAENLIRSVADRAQWTPHTGPQTLVTGDGLLRGRGFAYATYVHGAFPGVAAASSAWVADVEVNRTTGDVSLTRLVVGQDSGLMINPAGVRHQIHGNVIQSASRVLKEQVTFDRSLVASREWGAYPIITFPDIPPIEVVMVQRPGDPPLGVGESASVPSAAAIANAIFDATGVRFRDPPFTPERIRAGLNPLPPPSAPRDPRSARRAPKPKRHWLGVLTGAGAGALGLVALLWPFRPAIEPVARPDPGVFSAATIARGRLVAAAGDCAVCHAGPDGEGLYEQGLGGGRPLHTPFGVVYATNISPDPATGIGAWSYPAFERAMRAGVSRDGHHLYPAHPYTAFAKTNDADLQALYAFLLAQPAVVHAPPVTRLTFPFGLRPLMAGWNALFHRAAVYQPDPARSDLWNRGAYLVEGLGHCAACHSPRNIFGAEQRGGLHLAGGVVDGWTAPALTSLSAAPVPWTEDEFYSFLTTGQSRVHGVAAGPMAPVVAELALLPEGDRRAIAHYLASFQTAEPAPDDLDRMVAALGRPSAEAAALPGARLWQGACAACHEPGSPVQFGAKPNLAVNSNLFAATPDNLIQVTLQGIAEPARAELGAMPSFAASFSDAQVADLMRYLRARFAPEESAWPRIESSVARIRAGGR